MVESQFFKGSLLRCKFLSKLCDFRVIFTAFFLFDFLKLERVVSLKNLFLQDLVLHAQIIKFCLILLLGTCHGCFRLLNCLVARNGLPCCIQLYLLVLILQLLFFYSFFHLCNLSIKCRKIRWHRKS